MKNNNKKIKIPSLEERKKKHERSLEDLELKNKLQGSPELFIEQKNSDEYLDALSLIIKLRGGEEFTLEEYVTTYIVEYESHFYKDYYYAIARLFNIPTSLMDNYVKPDCARDITLEFVYARFPKKVVDYIMSNTQWSEIPGVRIHKLFQRLSPRSAELLDMYIQQAERAMNECSSPAEFKEYFRGKYKTSYQLDLF